MKGLAEIEKAILALPVEQLAESLLNSLLPIGDEMSEAAEMEESDRRDRQIEAGEVQPLSPEELFRRVESNRKR